MANGKNDYIAGIVNHPEVSDAVAIVIERRGEKYCVGADRRAEPGGPMGG